MENDPIVRLGGVVVNWYVYAGGVLRSHFPTGHVVRVVNVEVDISTLIKTTQSYLIPTVTCANTCAACRLAPKPQAELSTGAGLAPWGRPVLSLTREEQLDSIRWRPNGVNRRDTYPLSLAGLPRYLGDATD